VAKTTIGHSSSGEKYASGAAKPTMASINLRSEN
jgi:hypothetical protein